MNEPSRRPEEEPTETVYAPARQASKARSSGVLGAPKEGRSFIKSRSSLPLRKALSKALLRIFWDTCRITEVRGAQHLDRVIEHGEPAILAYWHQMHLFCSRFLLSQVPRGLKVAFLISPSRSGDVGAGIIADYGGCVLRGSDTRTGGQALQQLHKTIRSGISPVVTLDGPRGPAEECKPGAVLLARLTGAPMLPLAYAARRSRHLRTWDRFVLPLPFTRIAVAIGEPIAVPRDTAVDDFARYQQRIGTALAALRDQAKAALR